MSVCVCEREREREGELQEGDDTSMKKECVCPNHFAGARLFKLFCGFVSVSEVERERERETGEG